MLSATHTLTVSFTSSSLSVRPSPPHHCLVFTSSSLPGVHLLITACRSPPHHCLSLTSSSLSCPAYDSSLLHHPRLCVYHVCLNVCVCVCVCCRPTALSRQQRILARRRWFSAAWPTRAGWTRCSTPSWSCSLSAPSPDAPRGGGGEGGREGGGRRAPGPLPAVGGRGLVEAFSVKGCDP